MSNLNEDPLVERAKQYISAYESILNDFIKDRPDDRDVDLVDKFEKQIITLDSLKLRSKILFSESNKGEIFLKEVEDIAYNDVNPKRVIYHHKRVLEDFIHFRDNL